MSRTTVPTPPLAVDVAVTLTAIVRAEPDTGGYSACIPALPGCHTQGETLDEVRANLREAAAVGSPLLTRTGSRAMRHHG
jgi:predicted RNase H-like HicB family nuclease